MKILRSLFSFFCNIFTGVVMGSTAWVLEGKKGDLMTYVVLTVVAVIEWRGTVWWIRKKFG